VAEARSVGEAVRLYLRRWHIHLQTRLKDEKQCILVLIGATPEGRKELVGITDGARESARTGAICCSTRSGAGSPQLTIADGALGFCNTAGEVCRKRASSAAGCTRP
jgi:putative transposase